MNENKPIIAERIKNLRKENGLTQEKLAEILGLNAKSSIANYESGANSPSDDIKKKLCELFNCSMDYLMGVTDIREPIDGLNTSILDEDSKKNVYGIYEAMHKQMKLDKQKTCIPILGTVKAGYDWLAEENVIGYITDKDTVKDYEKNINEYYALKVIGDSMLPLLSEGDLVIVHDQDDVESGQTAVVLINGEEATVKKVIKTNEGIELHAMNPYYPIKKFTFEDMKNIPIKIIGRVKEAKIKGAFE